LSIRITLGFHVRSLRMSAKKSNTSSPARFTAQDNWPFMPTPLRPPLHQCDGKRGFGAAKATRPAVALTSGRDALGTSLGCGSFEVTRVWLL
jgi:hypothetical protein